MLHLAPPKAFNIDLHWFQNKCDSKLPTSLKQKFDNLDKTNEFIVCGMLKAITRISTEVYNPKAGAPVRYYDAYNIQIGDWIANSGTTFVWRIAEIYIIDVGSYPSSILRFYAKMVDYARSNESIDKSTRSIGCPYNIDSNAIVFTTDDYGKPILSGLNTFIIDPNFATLLQSRFSAFNTKRQYVSIRQSTTKDNLVHADPSTLKFNIGDPVYLDPVTCVYNKPQNTLSTNLQYTIGIVTSVGIPSYEYFTFSPFGEYRSYNEIPYLLEQKSTIGTIFYVDPTGEKQYITEKPDEPYPVYQIIDKEGNAVVVCGKMGGNSGPAGPAGPAGPTGPAGPPGTGIYSSDVNFDSIGACEGVFYNLEAKNIRLKETDVRTGPVFNYSSNTLYWNGEVLAPFPKKLVVNDSVTNNLLTNYLGSQNEQVYFTSPFQADIGGIATLNTKNIYISGLPDAKGHLHTDDTGGLYWNDTLIVAGNTNTEDPQTDSISQSMTASTRLTNKQNMPAPSPVLDTITASDADIQWLRINKIGVIQPASKDKSIEIVSKIHAEEAKINSLEVSSLVFTVNNKSQQTDILLATGPSKKSGNSLIYSTNNKTWLGIKTDITEDFQIQNVKWNGTYFLASAILIESNTASIIKSTDGKNWETIATLLDYQAVTSINYFKEKWVITAIPKAKANVSYILISPDGKSWINSQGFVNRETLYTKLVHNNNQILALGKQNGTPLTVIINSTDLTNWSDSLTPSFTLSAISADWDGTKWVAVGESSTDDTFMYSTDGRTWAPTTSPIKLQVGLDIKWNPNQKYWLSTGIANTKYITDPHTYANNSILRSEDGLSWTPTQSNRILMKVCCLLWTGNYWIASGSTTHINTNISNSNKSIIRSDDGLTWYPILNSNKGFIESNAYNYIYTLEKATVSNDFYNRMQSFTKKVITTEFDSSSDIIQFYDVQSSDEVIMVKFYKSASENIAEPANLQIRIYSPYFCEGHILHIQSLPYEKESDDLTIDEYNAASYTICSPNSELTIEPNNPYIDSFQINQNSNMRLLFYNGQWIKV